MFVSALLICIVLRAFSAQARVDNILFGCDDFFYRNTEPGGMDQNAKKICQLTYNNPPHYATLYSVHHRIPLYSAYRFDKSCFTDSGRLKFWHLEQQLSNPDQNLYYMVRESERLKRIYKDNQATSDDYLETGYDRGHLNPNSFQCGEHRTATFTLTNAVPMDACFNRNQWAMWEKKLRTFLRDELENEDAKVYIVTGTVPNVNLRIPQSEISDEPERVTVPSHIWTAVCYEHNSDKRKSFSFAYMGENKPEGIINLMSVPHLNTQIKNLNGQLSEVRIFVDDCFHDNNKLDDVKVKFQTLINQQIKETQGVQMSSSTGITYQALKRVADSSIIPEKKFKVSEMTVKLSFDNINSYWDAGKNLKFSGSACLLTHVKPLVSSGLRKRDTSGASDAVECLLVPEKQKTAADGSSCWKYSDYKYSCECEKNGEIKSCCSTPCLYQDNHKSYRCYSGQTQIECSPRYSLVTYKGEKCLDDHPCATYGKDYYWCNKISGSWDYCSPPLWRSKDKNGKYCRSDHACAKYGSRHMWCYTDNEDNYDDCCTSDDCYSAVNGQTCRSNHKCGYHGYSYLWCYTDYENNSARCCRSC